MGSSQPGSKGPALEPAAAREVPPGTDASGRAASRERPRLQRTLHRCREAVSRALDRAHVRDGRALVAVSGGGDSMALLELVAGLAAGRGLSLHVGCVDHGMRPEARQEACMVEEAASRAGATFSLSRIDPGRGDEDTLRRARRGALLEAARASDSRWILLGHSADDQIETLVLRFVRGAGTRGLSGMREANGPWVRPLLGLRRTELREALGVIGVRWSEDPSNLSPRYARGRLRTGVLPAIEDAFGRGALDHLLETASRWRDDEDFLEVEAARLLAFASRPDGQASALHAESLATAHRAIRARALRRWLRERCGHEIDVRTLAGVERWLDAGPAEGSGIDLPGARLKAEGPRLRVSPAVRLPADAASPGARGEAAPAMLPPSGGRVRFPRS